MSDKLPIVEMFHSIQGEGVNTGKSAYFIRIGGCDVCCTWCDEKTAWNEKLYPLINVSEIFNNVISSKVNTVVLTGGEPFRYNLTHLNKLLRERKILCMAETLGTAKITGNWDWITLSPKQHHKPLEENYIKANELKVVIQKEKDFLWAEETALKVGKNTILYLQPEWGCFDVIISSIIRYIKENPKWRLSVQVHKFLKIQ